MNDLIERQREHFNGIADVYYSARINPNHLLLKDLIWSSFASRNKAVFSQVSSVLEPMCGMAEGREIVSKYFVDGFKYSGFDYSENMVDIAKNANPELDIRWGDVTTYQADGVLFDLIVLIGGLHHVFSRTREVVLNLKSAIPSGGLFLSFEPTHNNFVSRWIRERIYAKNPFFDNDTEQGFNYEDLKCIFVDAGFVKVDEVYPGLLAYVLYYNPDAFPGLNRGGTFVVKALFYLDKLFWSSWVGRKLSFATISLWRKS